MGFTTWSLLIGHSTTFGLFSLVRSQSAAPQHLGIITPKEMLTSGGFSLLSHSYSHSQDLFYPILLHMAILMESQEGFKEQQKFCDKNLAATSLLQELYVMSWM